MTERERYQKRAAAGYFRTYIARNKAKRREAQVRWLRAAKAKRAAARAASQVQVATLVPRTIEIQGETIAERFKNYRNAIKPQNAKS
jgi:hypothetical protein